MGSRQSWAHWLSATRGLMAPSQAMGLVVIDSTCGEGSTKLDRFHSLACV